ncbi:translation initiation factor IF-2-like [Vulpes lagopus]|uniref:translation initiation factor IF-2-like n=1 Tax=Vulpes lagopus TaxID=494514 RepID=UPI001BCA1925|nr:translation initiation factor IF-2-like [Vulpes lagopus]
MPEAEGARPGPPPLSAAGARRPRPRAGRGKGVEGRGGVAATVAGRGQERRALLQRGGGGGGGRRSRGCAGRGGAWLGARGTFVTSRRGGDGLWPVTLARRPLRKPSRRPAGASAPCSGARPLRGMLSPPGPGSRLASRLFPGTRFIYFSEREHVQEEPQRERNSGRLC